MHQHQDSVTLPQDKRKQYAHQKFVLKYYSSLPNKQHFWLNGHKYLLLLNVDSNFKKKEEDILCCFWKFKNRLNKAWALKNLHEEKESNK